MTIYKCISCGRSWGNNFNDEDEVSDFCPVCAEQSIVDLIREIRKKNDVEKDRKMAEYWSKRKKALDDE